LRVTGHQFCQLSHFFLVVVLTSILGVEANSGFLYCSACNDFIYDAELEARYFAMILSAEEKQTKFKGAIAGTSNQKLITEALLVSQKPRETYRRWIPSEREVAALADADTIPCQGRFPTD
jgi:ubiquitin carboxyl-terminal hydrolase 22/27/51